MAEIEILDLEEGSGETGEISNRCLVGKVLHSKSLSATVITNILAAAWKTRAPFNAVSWNNNVFLFQFEDIEDKAAILMDGPWSVMNSLLILKPLVEGLVVSRMDFSKCPIWVQIHGLPVEKMNRSNAITIGRRFGKLLAVEGSAGGLLLCRSFLRVKVEIDVNKALAKGFWLRRKKDSDEDLWISYRYEKLPDFCYACGRVGHDNRGCKFVPRDEGMNSGYGPNLRTGRARKLEIQIEEIPHSEDVAGGVGVNEGRGGGSGDALLHNGGQDDARVNDAVVERVRLADSENRNPTSGGVRTPHRTSPIGVLPLPGVGESQVTGTPPRTPPQNICWNLSDNGSIGAPNHNTSGSTMPAGNSLSHIRVDNLLGLAPLPNPHLHICPDPITIPAKRDYYVTEPSDSPKSSSIGPNFDFSLNDQTQPSIEEVSPIASPTFPAQPNPLDLTLASAFNTLNIKRKAHDNLSDPGKSKILKLCGPDPNPIPKPVTPRSYRKGGRGGRSQTTGGKRNLNSLLNVEQNLCDVTIQQAYTDSMVDVTMVPIGAAQKVVENPDGVLVFPGDEKGLVAGPNQPPPQC